MDRNVPYWENVCREVVQGDRGRQAAALPSGSTGGGIQWVMCWLGGV